jgi:hypothetical protein
MPKITVTGRGLIAGIKNLRLKAAIATRHLVADILVGRFLLSSRFANAVGLTEILVKALGLNKTDTVVATELIEFDYSKNVDETPAVTDLMVIGLEKPEADSFTASDFAYAAIGKNINDQISFSDITSLSSGFGASDAVYATDDVGAQATIDDDQYMLFGKNLTEPPSVTDVVSITAAYLRDFSESVGITDSFVNGLAKIPGESLTMSETFTLLAEKSESDTLLSADSGILISQDYVDNNQYFDADYVGQSRTF